MDKIKNESSELDSTLEEKSTFKPFLKEKGHSIGKSTVNNYIRQNTPKTPSIIE